MDFDAVEDVHDVASILKLYVRELPEPLLTFALYSEFVNAIGVMELYSVSLAAFSCA